MKTLSKIISVAMLISFLSCSDLFDDSLGEIEDPVDVIINIELKVTGSAKSVFVTYENKDGGTSQIDSVSVPWSYTYTGNTDDFYYISAQNNGENGTVTVTAYKNGQTMKTSTSSGAYVIASVSGSI
jgi:hypothetical protein